MTDWTYTKSSKPLTLARQHNTKSCSVKTQAVVGSDETPDVTESILNAMGKALETLKSDYVAIRLVF